MPFREAQFTFVFGFGTEDLLASVTWMDEVDRLDVFDLKKSDFKDYVKGINDMSSEEYTTERKRAAEAVRLVWAEVETTFLPTKRKYA